MSPSNKTLEDFLTDNKRYRKSQFSLLPSIGDNETSRVSLPNLDDDANLAGATEDEHDARQFRNKGKGKKSRREFAPERPKASRKSRRTRDRSAEHFVHRQGDYEQGGHVSRPRQVVRVTTMSAPKFHEDDKKQCDVQARALADIETAKLRKMMKDLKRDQKDEPSPVIPARLAQKAPITNSPYVASRSRNNSETRTKPQDIAEAVSLFKEIRGEIVPSSDISKATVDRRALPDYQYHYKNLVIEKSKRALSLQAPFRQPERARARNLSCDYNCGVAKPRYLPPLDSMADEYEKYSRSAPIVKAKKADDTKVAKESGEKRLKKKKPLIVRHTKKSSQMQANMKDKKHMQQEERHKAVPARSKVSVAQKQFPQRLQATRKEVPKIARRSPVVRQKREASLESVISVTQLKGTAKDATAKSCKKQASSHGVTRSHGNTALSAKKTSSGEKLATSASPRKDAVSPAKSEKKACSPVSIKISCPRVSRASTASADSFYSDKESSMSARSAKALSSSRSAPKSVDRASSARSANKPATPPASASKASTARSHSPTSERSTSARSAKASCQRSARSPSQASERSTSARSRQRSARSPSQASERSTSARSAKASRQRSARSPSQASERSTSARSAKATPQRSARSATPEPVRSVIDAAQNTSRASSARPTTASPKRTSSSTPAKATARSNSAKSASQSPERVLRSGGTTPRSRAAHKSASHTSRSAKSDRSATAVSPTRSEKTRDKSSRASARSQPASSSTSHAKIDGYSPIPSARSTRSSKSAQTSARGSPMPSSRSAGDSLQSARSATARPKSDASVKSNGNEEKPHSARSATSRVSSRTQPKESRVSSARNDTERSLSSRNAESSARNSRSSAKGSASATSGRTSKSSLPSARNEKESTDSTARASTRSSIKEARSGSSKSHASANMPSPRSCAPSACSNLSTKSAKHSVNSARKSNDEEKYAAGSKSSSSHTLRSSVSRHTEASLAKSRRSDVKSSKSTTRSAVSVASSATPSPRSSVHSARTATPSARSVRSSRNSVHFDTPVRSGAGSAVSGEAITPRGSSSKGSCRLTRSPL